MNDALDGIPVFLAVAEEKGFRAAGKRLGVSGSAVSHSLRRLEERLGIALVQRTTRSVRLTEAGTRLYSAVRPAFEEARAAVRAVGEMADQPRGTIRLRVAETAASFLSGRVIEEFLRAFPEIRIEVMGGGDGGDIVAEGYDAGIRLGEMIEQDMITVPVSGNLRLVVVGSPAYFATHPPPAHPRELVHHPCINRKPDPDALPYRWEFTEEGRDFAVAVNAQVLTNDVQLMLRLAISGVGLTILWESWSLPHVQRGELIPVLEEYSTPFPGFYLYYPSRRHTSPALRAFIDYLLSVRRR